mmetsp:Transcript_19273/g.23868  ORF Transcript_19273/g.23868 Transcript_19273/m.23868 type:complete len:86 (+) Transcript_19273:205-462(+)
MTEEMVTSPLPPIIDWAKLRQMSRSNMTSKMLQGWTVDTVKGNHCDVAVITNENVGIEEKATDKEVANDVIVEALVTKEKKRITQ